jgi:hypothetical protein
MPHNRKNRFRYTPLKMAAICLLLGAGFGCSAIVPEYKTPVSAEHEKEKAEQKEQGGVKTGGGEAGTNSILHPRSKPSPEAL